MKAQVILICVLFVLVFLIVADFWHGPYERNMLRRIAFVQSEIEILQRQSRELDQKSHEAKIVAVIATERCKGFGDAGNVADDLRTVNTQLTVLSAKVANLENRFLPLLGGVEDRLGELEASLSALRVSFSLLKARLEFVEFGNAERFNRIEERLQMLEAEDTGVGLELQSIRESIDGLRLKASADIARLDEENRLVHYNYDGVLLLAKRNRSEQR